MSTQVLLPRMGLNTNESTLAEWLVADGALVDAGLPLFALESDKAVQEIEAPASGRLTIFARAGVSYPVGYVLAEIV